MAYRPELPHRWWTSVCVPLALSAAVACVGAPAADQPGASRVTPKATATDALTPQPTPAQASVRSTPTVIAMTISPTPLSPEDRARLTAELVRAAEAGDVDAVGAALRQGADRDGRDARGRTPLMAATHGNQVDVVRVLLDAGSDVDLQDDRLDNPFLYAGAEGLLDILRLTIAAGADTRLTNRFGGTALIPAAERGHVDVVRELLTTTDIDVNHINNLGWTALLEAIVLSDGGPRHQAIVELLLAHGADPALADFDGVTPLEHARRRGFSGIAALLEAGP